MHSQDGAAFILLAHILFDLSGKCNLYLLDVVTLATCYTIHTLCCSQIQSLVAKQQPTSINKIEVYTCIHFFHHSSHEFVVCETERFSRLAELPSSCFKVVRRGVVMEGYQMAVIQEWALNRARWVSRMYHRHVSFVCRSQFPFQTTQPTNRKMSISKCYTQLVCCWPFWLFVCLFDGFTVCYM